MENEARLTGRGGPTEGDGHAPGGPTREDGETLGSLDGVDGLSVSTTDTDDDDPRLLAPDGQPVDTWREAIPYAERLPRTDYERQKRLLHRNDCCRSSSSSCSPG